MDWFTPEFLRSLGGPGSGWTAEGGHVPGSQGERPDHEIEARTQDKDHGTVVVKSKLGQVEVVRGHSAPGTFDRKGDTRYIARRKNGEAVGTFKRVREAKEALRKPKNPDSFISGHLLPDVEWKDLS